jgi:hypothetical protein
VGCSAKRILGLDGYGYAHKPRGISTIALYNCSSTRYGEFLSKDAGCEGNGKGELLGYALP